MGVLPSTPRMDWSVFYLRFTGTSNQVPTRVLRTIGYSELRTCKVPLRFSSLRKKSLTLVLLHTTPKTPLMVQPSPKDSQYGKVSFRFGLPFFLDSELREVCGKIKCTLILKGKDEFW